MLITPYLEARSLSRSTSTFTTFARPAYSVANCSTDGPIALHGPHHSAQKSTSTGTSELSTFSWNSPVVTANCSAINLSRKKLRSTYTSRGQGGDRLKRNWVCVTL